MNAITVTREYGAGGYEVARRLAELLGWELLDKALLHRAAEVEHLPDSELERLDEKAVSLIDRFRLHPPHERYLHGLKEAARQAAAKGDVVLVGRGTGQLLADVPDVLHLRLTAPRDWRARRMAQKEGWTAEAALARCAAEDTTRDRFTRYFFGEAPFRPSSYHATFDTARVPLEDVSDCVAAIVRAGPLPEAPPAPGARRVLTLSRELAAGESDFAAALAGRLGLKVYDRALLEEEAVRLGVSAGELEKVDEQPAGFFQRFRPGDLHRRYAEAMGQIMKELAGQTDVLLVGRGGSRFLREDASAFHVRLVAPPEVRLRRVMEHRWLREGPARQLIADSDGKRRRFYENCFGADWADPLEYHLTVNAVRLGPRAVDLVALAAGRHWARVAVAR
jgi:cytidylate kinase